MDYGARAWDYGKGEWTGTWYVYGSRAGTSTWEMYMGKEHGVGTFARTFGKGMGQGHGFQTLARACHVTRTGDKCIGQSHERTEQTRDYGTRVWDKGMGQAYGSRALGRGMA